MIPFHTKDKIIAEECFFFPTDEWWKHWHPIRIHPALKSFCILKEVRKVHFKTTVHAYNKQNIIVHWHECGCFDYFYCFRSWCKRALILTNHAFCCLHHCYLRLEYYSVLKLPQHPRGTYRDRFPVFVWLHVLMTVTLHEGPGWD